MQLNILKRAISASALVALAAVLAGCGGGSSSSNIDEGTTYDPVNGCERLSCH